MSITMTYEQYNDLRSAMESGGITENGRIKSLDVSPLNEQFCTVDIGYASEDEISHVPLTLDCTITDASGWYHLFEREHSRRVTKSKVGKRKVRVYRDGSIIISGSSYSNSGNNDVNFKYNSSSGLQVVCRPVDKISHQQFSW